MTHLVGKSSDLVLRPMYVAHDALTLCLVADSEPVRTAVRACCLPPHRLDVFSFDGLLTPEHTLSPEGERLVETAAGSDALLVGWALDRAPLVAMLAHAVRRAAGGADYTPVLALCGGAQEDAVAAYAAGVDDVVHFPLFVPLLQARIVAHRRTADVVRRVTSRRLLARLEERHEQALEAAQAQAQAGAESLAAGMTVAGPPGDGAAPEPEAAVQAVQAATADLVEAAVQDVAEALLDEVEDELVLMDPTHDVTTVGPLRLDHTAYRFFVGEQEVELTPKEFELLGYLMTHAGEACARDAILDEVWGIDFDTGTNMVDAYVYFLRKKLGGHGLRGMIQTVRGRGYRLADLAPGRTDAA